MHIVGGMAEKNFEASAGQQAGQHWSRHKFTYLLATLVLLFLVFPFLESADIGRHLFIAAITLILIASIWAVSHTRRNFYIALALGTPAIILSMAEEITNFTALYYAIHLFIFASFVFTVLVLFSHMLRARRVTHDEILGAISVYVMIAMAFSSLYFLADRLAPGSFIISAGPQTNGQLTYSDYIYYSFGTITTSGSGNIVEVGPLVRSLSMIEAVIGIFYVAFIVSKLVASFEDRKQ